MRRGKKYCFWLLMMLACSYILSAQSVIPGKESIEIPVPAIENSLSNHAASFVVRNIVIAGNKKTKPYIILRELPFKTGDQFLLQDLVKKFELAREQLMNTTLFHEVIVALKSFEGYNVDILVEVRERWYLFPIPYMKPVDRNFNQWLVDEKGSLDRLDYGLKLIYNNTTGRNDKLSAWLIEGYTQQLSFAYNRLYIDKSLKWGGGVKLSIGKTHDINYNTIGDKQVFLKDNNVYLLNFLNATAELTYRPAIKTRHRFGLAYTVQNVSDTVLSLNPSYFSSGRHFVRFPEIYYSMSYFDVDYIPYPTKGYTAGFTFDKKGLNNIINVWQLSMRGSGSWHLLRKTYLTLHSALTIKVPFKQPYFNQQLLGYGDMFIQGYEYYVIDGVAGGYLNATFSRELLNFHSNFLQKKRGESLHIPIRIFAKIYGNTGYAYNPQPGQNSLSNKMLYSGGLGIDIITFYDLVIKLEWTFNQLGQNGLFLHNQSSF